MCRILGQPVPALQESCLSFLFLEDAVMWLNRGSTYEKNVEAREDICLIKHGFQIPTGIDVYSAFTEQMRCNEIKFLDGILISMK